MRIKSRVLAMASAGLWAAIQIAAQPVPTSDAPLDRRVIKLPEYVVKGNRELPPPESWRYVYAESLEVTVGKRMVRTPGFRILSNLSETNTRVFVHELQLNQLVGAIFWPALVNIRRMQAPIIILDRTLAAPEANTNWTPSLWEGIEAVVPVRSQTAIPGVDAIDLATVWERPPGYDNVLTASENQQTLYRLGTLHELPMAQAWLSTGASATFSMPVPFQSTQPGRQGFGTSLAPTDAQIFAGENSAPLPSGLVSLSDRHGILAFYANASFNRREDDLAKQVNVELMKHTVADLGQSPPLWLQAGLSWLIQSTNISAKIVTLGTLPEKFHLSGKSSLATLFAAKNNLSADQVVWARLFIYYCLFEESSKYASGFAQFGTRIHSEPANEKLFKQCFGVGYAEIESQLNRIVDLRNMDYAYTRRRTFPIQLPNFVRKIDVREATQAEVAQLKGDSFLARDDLARALEVLRVTYARGDRPPNLIAELAELEERAGVVDRAQKLVDALLSSGHPPARALYTQSRLHYREATAHLTPGAKIPSKTTTYILSPLAQALHAGWATEEAATLFAEVVCRSEGRPDQVAIGFVNDLAIMYPANDKIKEAKALVATFANASHN